MSQGMSSKKEQLELILGDFKRNCDITGAAVVTSRGQMIWSLLPQSVEEKAVSAMAAAIRSIGVRVSTTLDSGFPETILIDSHDKTIVLKGNDKILVIGIAPYKSELALINFELNTTVKRITEVMEDSAR